MSDASSVDDCGLFRVFFLLFVFTHPFKLRCQYDTGCLFYLSLRVAVQPRL